MCYQSVGFVAVKLVTVVDRGLKLSLFPRLRPETLEGGRLFRLPVSEWRQPHDDPPLHGPAR